MGSRSDCYFALGSYVGFFLVVWPSYIRTSQHIPFLFNLFKLVFSLADYAEPERKGNRISCVTTMMIVKKHVRYTEYKL
jgi:hypothetical protein